MANYYTQIMGGDLMEAKTEQLEKFRVRLRSLGLPSDSDAG